MKKAFKRLNKWLDHLFGNNKKLAVGAFLLMTALALIASLITVAIIEPKTKISVDDGKYYGIIIGSKGNKALLDIGGAEVVIEKSDVQTGDGRMDEGLFLCGRGDKVYLVIKDGRINKWDLAYSPATE